MEVREGEGEVREVVEGLKGGRGEVKGGKRGRDRKEHLKKGERK